MMASPPLPRRKMGALIFQRDPFLLGAGENDEDIGALAGLSGAIFIDRSRPKALPATVAEVTAALRAGRSVAAFPEGTTFCGANQGRFRPALFQAAINSGVDPKTLPIYSYDYTRGADGTVTLNKVIVPQYVGDPALRAGLSEVRELIGPLPGRIGEFVSTFGR